MVGPPDQCHLARKSTPDFAMIRVAGAAGLAACSAKIAAFHLPKLMYFHGLHNVK
jgi:hypothetical protein